MKFLGDLMLVEGSVFRVGLIHNMPFDPVHGLGKSAAELQEIGALVEDVPAENPPQGQRTAGIYVDKDTGEVFWQYEAEEMAAMDNATAARLDALENTLGLLAADIVMGG